MPVDPPDRTFDFAGAAFAPATCSEGTGRCRGLDARIGLACSVVAVRIVAGGRLVGIVVGIAGPVGACSPEVAGCTRAVGTTAVDITVAFEHASSDWGCASHAKRTRTQGGRERLG